MLIVAKAMSRRIGAVGDDDVLFRFRLRLFSLAEEPGDVRAACRAMDVHPSTYYRWKAIIERSGLEMLRPRERRAPRMPNQLSPVIETRILAFAIAHPGLGPRRISASLAQERWGGIVVSHNGVWRVLRRHGLSRRIARLSLVAGYAAPPGPEPLEPEPDATSRSTTPESWWASTVSMLVGSAAPAVGSGSTPPSTWPPPAPGPSCIRHR
jgi:transposase